MLNTESERPQFTLIYPDMDKKAEELAIAAYELTSSDDVTQKMVDNADTMLLEHTSNLTHNSELASALELLKKDHSDIAKRIENVVDAALIRDYIQQHAY